MKLLCWKPMSSRFKQMAAITTHSSGALWWKAMGTGRCGVFAVWKLCDPHLSASAVNSLLWGAIQMSFLVPCSGLILYYIVFYCKCGLFSDAHTRRWAASLCWRCSSLLLMSCTISCTITLIIIHWILFMVHITMTTKSLREFNSLMSLECAKQLPSSLDNKLAISL